MIGALYLQGTTGPGDMVCGGPRQYSTSRPHGDHFQIKRVTTYAMVGKPTHAEQRNFDRLFRSREHIVDGGLNHLR